MLKGNKKLFLDRQKLYKLTNLRISGWAMQSLATLFNCDRNSVYHQLKKYNIISLQSPVYDIERLTSSIIPKMNPTFKSQWEVKNGERINLGRSYADYVALSKYPHTHA